MAVPRDPTRPSPDGLDADALAVPGGVPPVVWLAAAASDALSPQVASALLDEHTEHGDVVVDVDDDVAFAAAAAETGRRHHALGGDHHLTALTFGSGHHPGSRRAAAQTGVNADTAADRPADDSSADTATGVGQTTPHTDLLIFAAEEDHHD